MKAVLISIRPNWCELIWSGMKTVEVRKTRPTLETPFKAYIYCTGHDSWIIKSPKAGVQKMDSRVIGEFICDDIRRIGPEYCVVKEDIESAIAGSCLTVPQIKDYAGWKSGLSYADLKDLYGWNISGLKIYDKPRDLDEFSRFGFCGMNGTGVCGNEGCEYYEPSGNYMEPPTCAIDGCYLKRPPQSWCYVEEIE